ncbi:Uncharacterized protein QTN25_010472 [Entamoeba marina]
MFSIGNLFKRRDTPKTPSKTTSTSLSKSKQSPDLIQQHENMIPQPEIPGVTLFSEYTTHSFNFVNELGNCLELMTDYSTESTNLAIRRIEAMDASLKRMEYLSGGLEKYLNEMVMLAQTPKPALTTEATPFQRQRTRENLIITQVNDAEQ